MSGRVYIMKLLIVYLLYFLSLMFK